jgi:hydrogenase small subunit
MGNLNEFFDTGRNALDDVERRLDMTRREFLQFCATLATTLGLPQGADAAVAEAVETKAAERDLAAFPGMHRLHRVDVARRASHAGKADPRRHLARLPRDPVRRRRPSGRGGAQGGDGRNKGKYVLVVEGAIPTKDNGIYCKIGGKTAIELLKECAADAAAVIAIGSCASWGGMPSTDPESDRRRSSVNKIIGKPVVTIPGLPAEPLQLPRHGGAFPDLRQAAGDRQARPPLFAYSRLIHENCERRAHFDAGRFAVEFGDDGHRKGYCLYKLGCKGPETYANCSVHGASAMPARAPGRWAAATPASAAPNRALASPSRSIRWPR